MEICLNIAIWPDDDSEHVNRFFFLLFPSLAYRPFSFGLNGDWCLCERLKREEEEEESTYTAERRLFKSGKSCCCSTTVDWIWYRSHQGKKNGRVLRISTALENKLVSSYLFFFFFFFLFFTLLWNLLSTPRSRRDTSTFIFSRWQTEMDLLILDIYFFVINNGKKKKKKTHWAGNRSQLRMYKCLQNGPPVRSLFELQLKATIVLFTRVKCSDPYMVS